MPANVFRRINFTFFLSFFPSLVSFAFTGNSIVYRDKDNLLEIRTPIQFLEDKTNKKNIYEIAASDQFRWSKLKVANLGISSSTFWLKIEIVNKTNESNLLLELTYPLIDEVSLFSISNSGLMDSIQLGENKPFNHRKYKYQNYLFDLNIKPDESKVYFLRVKSGDQLLIPLAIGSSQVINESHTQKDLFAGIYFGIVIAMLLYNLFIYFSIRDRSYLLYVIYILFVGLTQATLQGYTFKYFWPGAPWLAIQSVFLTGALSGLATILFAKSFLQTRRFTPHFDTVLNFCFGIYIICIFLAIAGYHNLSYTLIDLNAGPGSLFLLFVAYKIYKKGYRPAKFFLLAWFIFLVSVSVFVMKDYGILPYNTFTYYGLQFGSAIEVLLLSFALADRINTLKREKEESQVKALEALQENERIIKEQNVVLDTKVRERTWELQESNRELNITLKRLKETQSQLVNSEKMASLGQLTAGIAHEINNPINFVSAGMKPLRRNISFFFTLLDKYDLIIAQTGYKDSFREVDLLKKKYDLEYCKEEITTILQGIEEGASRTTEIVKGLRNFSRLDEAELKVANINTGLDSTIILLQGKLSGRIKITKDYGAIPEIECYAGKLNQVFMNLLTNAIQAVQAKGLPSGEGCITVRTLDNENEVTIRFTDNGIGMSEEVKHRIFEPFFTTKEVGEGTGLGMSIAYSIIEMHKGRISIRSQEGVGTEIDLMIPKTAVPVA